MPNTKSAIRRTKRTKLQATVNKIRKNKYKAAIKKMTAFLNSSKIKEARDFLPKFHSELMKVAKQESLIKKLHLEKFLELPKASARPA